MTTMDQLLTDTARVDELSDAEFARSREALNGAIDTHGPRLRVPLLGQRGTVRRRLTVSSLIAATVAAAIAVPVLGIGGIDPSNQAAAATALRQAGRSAGIQPGGWPDAAYWHVTSTYIRDGRTYQRDIWIAHHGESVLLDRGLPGDPGVISLGTDTDLFDAGATPISWDQLYALPTNPNDLATVLRHDSEGAGNSSEQELFTTAADLLRETPASPALREALYDVAAKSTGVQLKGQVTDPAGRVGTAIERDGETLVIDTSTGQLLDDTEGTDFSATYVSQGPADTAPTVSPVKH